jgi:hypothetical protein
MSRAFAKPPGPAPTTPTRFLLLIIRDITLHLDDPGGLFSKVSVEAVGLLWWQQNLSIAIAVLQEQSPVRLTDGAPVASPDQVKV